MDGWKEERTEGWMDGRKKGRKEERKEGWKDGRKEGWKEGRKKGRKEGEESQTGQRREEGNMTQFHRVFCEHWHIPCSQNRYVNLAKQDPVRARQNFLSELDQGK